MLRRLIVLPLCLAAGCASTPASTPQAEAARQVYFDCLRDNLSRVEDSSRAPDLVGGSLADLCLSEFSRYRDISGVNDSGDNLNEITATRFVINHRRH